MEEEKDLIVPLIPFAVSLTFDGLCEPRNPGGLGCYGWQLRTAGAHANDGLLIDEGKGVAMLPGPTSTNNWAEWCALGFALRKLLDSGWKKGKLAIYGDSKLVIEQLNGTWQCRATHLIPLRDRCRKYLADMECEWSAEWIPREMNTPCDQLSREAYSEATEKS